MKFLTKCTEQDNFWFSLSNFLSFVMNLLEFLEKLIALFPDEYFSETSQARNVQSSQNKKATRVDTCVPPAPAVATDPAGTLMTL